MYFRGLIAAVLWLSLVGVAMAQCPSVPTKCGPVTYNRVTLGTAIDLGPLASPPAVPKPGTMYYNTGLGAPQFYNGIANAWVTIGTGGSGVSWPTNGTLVQSNTTDAPVGVPFGPTGTDTIVQTGSGGKINPAVIPAPGTSTFGGILGLGNATSGQFLQYIDTAGVQHLGTPSGGNAAGPAFAIQLQNSGFAGTANATVDLSGNVAFAGTGTFGRSIGVGGASFSWSGAPTPAPGVNPFYAVSFQAGATTSTFTDNYWSIGSDHVAVTGGTEIGWAFIQQFGEPTGPTTTTGGRIGLQLNQTQTGATADVFPAAHQFYTTLQINSEVTNSVGTSLALHNGDLTSINPFLKVDAGAPFWGEVDFVEADFLTLVPPSQEVYARLGSNMAVEQGSLSSGQNDVAFLASAGVPNNSQFAGMQQAAWTTVIAANMPNHANMWGINTSIGSFLTVYPGGINNVAGWGNNVDGNGIAVVAPQLNIGFDMRPLQANTAYWWSPGVEILPSSMSVGVGAISSTPSGLSINATGQYVSAVSSITTPGLNYFAGDATFDPDGGIYNLTSVDGSGATTGISIIQPGYVPTTGAEPSNPVMLAGGTGNQFLAVNLTWSAANILTLQSAGGLTVIGGGLSLPAAASGVQVSCLGLSSANLVVTGTCGGGGGPFLLLTGGAVTGATSFAVATTTAGIMDSGGINTTEATGYSLRGTTLLTAIGTTNASLLGGFGAGALLPSNDTGTTAFGTQACAADAVVSSENSCFGNNAVAHMINGFGATGIGDGALWHELSANSDTCGGADTCRNIIGTQFITAWGRRAVAYGAPGFAVGIGNFAYAGNGSAVTIGGTPSVGDMLNVTVSQATNALTVSQTAANLTVATAAANTLGIGKQISGAFTTELILSQTSGTTGGAGVYVVSQSQTIASSTSATAQGSPVVGAYPHTFSTTVTSGETTAQMAAALAAVCQADTTLTNNELQCSSDLSVVNLEFPGTSITGYALTTVVSVTNVGGGTETLAVTSTGTNGTNDIAIGYFSQAGYAESSASSIISIGSFTGRVLTTAVGADLIGSSVGSTTFASGTKVILVGTDVSTDTFSGGTSEAIGIGTGVVPGTLDTCVGYQTCLATGQDSNLNVAFGAFALTATTTASGGTRDTAVGDSAGRFVSTGVEEAFGGYSSGVGVVGTPLTGNFNSGWGASSLGSIRGAANNMSGFGYEAGFICQTCSGSTFLGSQVQSTGTGTAISGDIIIGVSSAAALTTSDTLLIEGNGSTATLNCSAISTTPLCTMPGGSLTLGVSTTTGGSLVLEGSTSGAATLTGGTTGALTTSANIAFSSATVALSGLASVTAATTGTVCYTTATLSFDPTSTCLVSSARFKHDVEPLTDALAEIDQMKPISFVYNGDKTGYVHFGMIAEDMAKIDPRLVTNDNEGRPMQIKYLDAISLLIEGMKEQQGEIDALRHEQRRAN
jgi:hypothetical protein